MKSIFIFFLGLVAVIYLLNPTAGIIELLPDNIPGVGNLDEATATAILISVLAYFGIDFSNFFQRKPASEKFSQDENIKEAKIVEDEE
jgi:uncharacterized membrane protein YkvA (DUF1232 family)